MDTYTSLQLWRAYQSAQKLSERTITDRADIVRRMAEFCGVEAPEATPDNIVAYVGRPNLSRTTAHTYHTHLHAYYKWLVLVGLREDDPTVRVPAPKRVRGTPRPITATEAKRLLDTVNRRKTRMMILLAMFAGLRAHEIAKVRGEEIDRDERTIIVTGKGGTTQMIPLHEKIAEAAVSFPVAGYWFPSTTGAGPIRRHAVGSTVAAVMRRAGIAEGGVHRLRHWYGSELSRAGVDLRVVQELMRHASIQSTQIYTHVDDSRRRAGIELLAA